MPVDSKDKPFLVEIARHNRAICKKCRQKCIQGNLRVARLAPNPVGSGTMKTWHHVDCIFELFLRQRKTTKRIEGTDDIEGWELLDNNDKTAIKKKIEDCNQAVNAKLQSSSKKSESGSPKKKLQPSDPLITEESTCGTPEGMSETEENRSPEFHHNSFRYFRIIIYDVSNARSADAKKKLLRNFFQDGTDGTGFKSDMYLWCKFLVPTATKRKIPFTPERLVEIFCEMFDLDLNNSSIKQRLDKSEHVSRKIPKLFEISKKCRPNTTYSLTLQEVDEFLEMLSTAKNETEQIKLLNNIVSKCSVRNLRFIIRLILQDLRMEFTAEHVLGAIHPEAYAMYQSCKDIKAVVEKYWREPTESERRKRSKARQKKGDTKSDKTRDTKKEATSKVQAEVSTTPMEVEASTSSPCAEGDVAKMHISPKQKKTSKTPPSKSLSEAKTEKKSSQVETDPTSSKAKPRRSSDQRKAETSGAQVEPGQSSPTKRKSGAGSSMPKSDSSPSPLKDDPSSAQAKGASSSSRRRARKRLKQAQAGTDSSQADVGVSSSTQAGPDSSKPKGRKSSEEFEIAASSSKPKGRKGLEEIEVATSSSKPKGRKSSEEFEIATSSSKPKGRRRSDEIEAGTSSSKPKGRKSSDEIEAAISSSKPKGRRSSDETEAGPSSSPPKAHMSSDVGPSSSRGARRSPLQTKTEPTSLCHLSKFQPVTDEDLPSPTDTDEDLPSPTDKDFEYDLETGVVYKIPEPYRYAREFYSVKDEHLIHFFHSPRFFQGVKILRVEDFMKDKTYKESVCYVLCLGGGITTDPKQATHVFYPESQTKKIGGLRNLKHVSTKWLKDTIEKDELQRIKNYLVG